MKRIVVILLLLALLACVPTPEEESVKNKANGTLEEMIRAEAEPKTDRADASAQDEKSPLYAQLGTP
ncbi:MAG: hypothetical protein II412_09400 [Clostridia bacterium]|nr:hypothetical protein [Clostridia bacterium]